MFHWSRYIILSSPHSLLFPSISPLHTPPLSSFSPSPSCLSSLNPPLLPLLSSPCLSSPPPPPPPSSLPLLPLLPPHPSLSCLSSLAHPHPPLPLPSPPRGCQCSGRLNKRGEVCAVSSKWPPVGYRRQEWQPKV